MKHLLFLSIGICLGICEVNLTIETDVGNSHIFYLIFSSMKEDIFALISLIIRKVWEFGLLATAGKIAVGK